MVKVKEIVTSQSLVLSNFVLAQSYSSVDTLGHGWCPDYLSFGNCLTVSLNDEASSTLDEEPISSFEKPDSWNSPEEASDEEQDAFKGLEPFCSVRDSQFLGSGEPSLEEPVVRSKIDHARVDALRDTSGLDTGLVFLPLSGFKPHKEDRSPDHSLIYIKSRSTRDFDIQSLNTTSMPGRAPRKDVPISEKSNPRNLDDESR